MPRFPHPSARPALKPFGPALPIAPLDEVASFPASCIFGFCRRPSFELPRLASFGVSLVEVQVAPFFVLWSRLPMRPPGCPGFCIFRPCRRWILELPRISHPSAHPALKPGVSPEALPLVVPVDAIPGLPRFLHLPALPATDLRVTPNLVSFGPSGAAALGCPSASHFQWRLPVWLRVAPPLSPSGFALGLWLRVAPNPYSPRRRLMVPRVASVPAPSGFAVPASSGCPESCIYGWVNDDFPVILELCILG